MTARIRKGFTLIELLIVMAILGVLAVVVLVAINPAEQLRRARDAGKVSGVQQLGRAVAAYYTGNGMLPGSGVLPATADWSTDIVTSQELTAMPAGVTQDGNTACTGGQIEDNTWCYKFSAPTDGVYVVYATLASEQKIAACDAAVPGSTPYAIFSSSSASGGVFCGGEPAETDVPTI